MAQRGAEVLAYRHFVNEANQIEGVELVKDTQNPDGVLLVQWYQEVTPRLPFTHRPFGRLVRRPDKPTPVRLKPTGEILGEATFEATNDVIDQWYDYGPLSNTF